MGQVQFDGNQGAVTIINDTKSVPRPSILGRLVEIIALGDCDSRSLDRLPSEIEEKIDFNDLKRCRWVVDQYVESSILIGESVKELNRTILNGGTKLKRQMNNFYKTSLAKFSVLGRTFNLTKLRECSDDIVMDVIQQTKEYVKSSSSLMEGYYAEDIDFGVNLIVSFAIIECVVLENEYAHA
ncbi:hypothetical protein [Pseudomonas aeruginosa]|uniref:hypothetical protein n=1 Tax=Pseudomonas aeruginosa TaxID=287 RepID=UPI0004F3557A|nr:hypothetical protein [Pseudomonas aeruginosa]DAN00114.1 MAG TPA: hypothetical protein [Inoviridae sp.]EKQ6337256.1 hypothetical protein [Pseudomonas aeruginosa]KSR23921.1 hypothetical protein APB49_16340 [Pseudomonas aeruginosa]MBG4566375.1 hypothetical protein [Pseudomonas aeruginosa]MBG5407344.1 hypothetical protein [Pseudomonas aeruginosa]